MARYLLILLDLYEYDEFVHSYVPCAILLCGCDNTVVNRHGALDRLADWHHHLLLVLLLHHLLIFISHWHLTVERVKRKTLFRKKSN